MMKKRNLMSFLILSSLILLMMVFPGMVSASEKGLDANIPFKVMTSGDSYPNHDRTFVTIETETNAPLPEVCKVEIVGAGEGYFGPIHYTSPGIYEYIVREKPGTSDNVVYDGSVYEVTVIVENKGDGLTSVILSKTIESSSKDPLVFTNVYEKPDKPVNHKTKAPVMGDCVELGFLGIAAVALILLVIVFLKKRQNR